MNDWRVRVVTTFASGVLLVGLAAGKLSVQAQEIPEALLKDLETVSQKQGEAFVRGIRELAERNKKDADALKAAFVAGKQDWRVRVIAGAVASCADNPSALEGTFERVMEIRKTHKAQPVEKAKVDRNDPPAGQDFEIRTDEGTSVVVGLPRGGQWIPPHRENDWLKGLPTPVKDLTAHEARVALMVMLVASPRPLLGSDRHPWDVLSLAVAFRVLTGLKPDGLLDNLVLDELRKVPLIEAHRHWAFEYVAARKLQAAVPIIRDSVATWTEVERTNWPDKAGSVFAVIGGAEAEACLIKWSTHEDVGFRLAAAKGLAALGSPQARTRLHYMATSDPLEAMRKRAKGLLDDLEAAKPKEH